jgi:prepilin-type N-terminal cleavage/methylation domain-containing protein
MIRGGGFTLPEMLIALTIFGFLIAGIVFANLFGLRMFQMTQTKLNVTRWSRETIENLADQIHGCADVQVGYTTNNGFAAFMVGEAQQGNALLIHPSTNTANYTIYYLNTADQTFCRTDQSSNALVLADSVTNSIAFTAQDLWGNVISNSANNQVIHITLEVYQPKYFMQDADYYKLETSVTRRGSQ